MAGALANCCMNLLGLNQLIYVLLIQYICTYNKIKFSNKKIDEEKEKHSNIMFLIEHTAISKSVMDHCS